MARLGTKTDREMNDEKAFIRNGSILLEKLVAFSNGRCYPIHNFSAEDIERATNNFDGQLLTKEDGYFNLYKGFSQDRPIMVKKFVGEYFEERLA
ncbi:hypothetical protein Tsubulata_037075, partial [Turnera subulata]